MPVKYSQHGTNSQSSAQVHPGPGLQRDSAVDVTRRCDADDPTNQVPKGRL